MFFEWVFGKIPHIRSVVNKRFLKNTSVNILLVNFEAFTYRRKRWLPTVWLQILLGTLNFILLVCRQPRVRLHLNAASVMVFTDSTCTVSPWAICSGVSGDFLWLHTVTLTHSIWTIWQATSKLTRRPQFVDGVITDRWNTFERNNQLIFMNRQQEKLYWPFKPSQKEAQTSTVGHNVEFSCFYTDGWKPFQPSCKKTAVITVTGLEVRYFGQKPQANQRQTERLDITRQHNTGWRTRKLSARRSQSAHIKSAAPSVGAAAATNLSQTHQTGGGWSQHVGFGFTLHTIYTRGWHWFWFLKSVPGSFSVNWKQRGEAGLALSKTIRLHLSAPQTFTNLFQSSNMKPAAPLVPTLPTLQPTPYKHVYSR